MLAALMLDGSSTKYKPSLGCSSSTFLDKIYTYLISLLFVFGCGLPYCVVQYDANDIPRAAADDPSPHEI